MWGVIISYQRNPVLAWVPDVQHWPASNATSAADAQSMMHEANQAKRNKAEKVLAAQRALDDREGPHAAPATVHHRPA